MGAFKVIQAVPGTDSYGWFVLVTSDGDEWHNFFGEHPKTTLHQLHHVTDNLEAQGLGLVGDYPDCMCGCRETIKVVPS